ncbi:hypothetical protein FM107_10340 [Sphingobacterium sp. JB170]|nr:hypothetical protein FM107_10340 [Sphingobacterium sp. JB170]
MLFFYKKNGARKYIFLLRIEILRIQAGNNWFNTGGLGYTVVTNCNFMPG